MNTKQIIAAAAIAFVGSTSAFAQGEAELQHLGAAQPSNVSRAAVKSETQRAQAAGELKSGESAVAAAPAATSGKTRAEVSAEVRQAIAADKYVRVGDMVQFATDVAEGPTRTREEVRAEAVASTRSAQAARVKAGH
jgi:hypothetical protein